MCGGIELGVLVAGSSGEFRGGGLKKRMFSLCVFL